MRSVIRNIGTFALVCILAGQVTGNTPAASSISADEALKAIQAGNTRYVAEAVQGLRRDQNRRCDTSANGQHPVAAVLACADSRVPVELIFDQGIGDLFVIRVAGNVANTDEIGTIEYGVGHLGIPLIVVMGHNRCGAVTAVVEKAQVHDSVAGLVANIGIATEKVRRQNPNLNGAALITAAIKANVNYSIEGLLTNSPSVREAVKAGKVKVVGAVYDLHAGGVEWLGQHPDEAKLLKGGATPVNKAKPASHGTISPGGHGSTELLKDVDQSHVLGAAGQGDKAQPEGEAAGADNKSKREHSLAGLASYLCGATVVSGAVLHFRRPGKGDSQKTG